MTDPLMRLLAELPQAEPDRDRAARVRARCHTALARHRPRSPSPRRRERVRGPLIAALGAVYLVESVRQALLLFGII
jgi:hypothetical protein